jgi:general secretion pathway protein M
MKEALQSLRTRWYALAARERRLLLLAASVVLLFLLWVLAVQPAWRTLATAPAELDVLDAQLQSMQRLAGEAATLRATPPVNLAQATEALQAATARLGDKGKLTMQGDRAVLTLTGAGTRALSDWLVEARSGARARPVEATLTRTGNGYNGSLVVAIGGTL